MYSPKVIEQRYGKVATKLGFDPQYHSVQKVGGANAHLNSLRDRETGKMLRSLDEEEIKWIKNERALCQIDFLYYATRYGFLKDWQNKTVRFVPWLSQRIVVDVWAEMEEAGQAISELALKARQLGKCLHPDTRVLTADLRWVKIDELTIGQEIIGVDEGQTREQWREEASRRQYYHKRGSALRAMAKWRDKRLSRRMLTTSVVGREDVYAAAIKLTMDDGRALIATSDHRFLCVRRSDRCLKWMKVKELRLGDEVRYITRLWDDPNLNDAWFGGLIDGEGCLRRKNQAGTELSVSQVLDNGVYKRAHNYLKSKGYTFREETDNRKNGSSSKLGNKPVGKLVINRSDELLAILGQARPTRFVGFPWWEGKALPGKNSGIGYSKIVNIELLPVQRMVDIQTESKTFIAEGFVSHNSTVSELAVAHRACFYPGVNAVVASSSPSQSEKMALMMETCWDNHPYWLTPTVTTYRRGELIEFGKMDSAVSIQHGSQFMGLARGSTPTVCHLSEIVDFADPEELIDASLLRAMHESPWMFLVLESTAKGRHNWLHNTWESSKEGWPRGRSRLRPVFLPWFVGSDIYPTDTWLNTRPIPIDWKPMDITLNHARRAAKYVHANDLLKKYLGDDWEMPIQQMWFWEVTREEYRKKKELAQFYSEMPADDQEAFQSTNISIFDVDTISIYREKQTEPQAVYGIITADMPERLHPGRREIDTNIKPIHVSNTLPNGKRFDAEFMPLKWKGYSGESFDSRLLVWEFPESGSEYGIGVDTGDGIGKDRTVMEVIRKGSVERNDFQSAEWASPYVNSYDLPPIAYAVGCLYSTRVDGAHHQAKMVVECNRNGEATQLELRKMGWYNFHRWMRYDNRKMKASSSNKVGWWTNVWSRPMMLDFLIKLLRDEWFDVNSPYFVTEMSELEASEDRQSIKCEYGGHDDRVMAAGMALFSMHALSLRGTQRNILREREEYKHTGLVYPTYQSPLHATDLDEDDEIMEHVYRHGQEPEEPEVYEEE